MKTDVPRQTPTQTDESDAQDRSSDYRSTTASGKTQNSVAAMGVANGRKAVEPPDESSPDRPDSEKPVRKDFPKKKKKRNMWPLWACVLSFFISVAVNVGSELVLDGTTIWVAAILVVVILFINVVFDMISMAVTTCDIEPFLAMASRKVRGAKTAVKLAKKADVVSSISGDIVGDICGVVSGVCSAAIAAMVVLLIQASDDFWISVLVTAIISTLTITCKAFFKKVAVDHANDIIFGVAKFLAFFKKDV